MLAVAYARGSRRPPGRRRRWSVPDSPPPAMRLAPRAETASDDCASGGALDVKHWSWQWGAVGGGLLLLVLGLVLICWCCRRRGHKPSRAWARRMMEDWQHTKRHSDGSRGDSVRKTPVKTDAESKVQTSLAFAGMPMFAAAQPTYVIQQAAPAPQSAASVAHPDNLYPRAPPSVDPTVSGFGPPPSSTSKSPWFSRRGSKGGSDSGSKGSRRGKASEFSTGIAPTYKGSEGGSSYHSDGLVSRSGFAFSSGPGSAAPTSSAPYGSEAPGSSSGSSYKPSRGPWGSSDVDIASGYDGTSTVGTSTRKAPSRTATGYSASAAPSAGRSRLRQMMNL